MVQQIIVCNFFSLDLGIKTLTIETDFVADEEQIVNCAKQYIEEYKEQGFVSSHVAVTYFSVDDPENIATFILDKHKSH